MHMRVRDGGSWLRRVVLEANARALFLLPISICFMRIHSSSSAPVLYHQVARQSLAANRAEIAEREAAVQKEKERLGLD